VTADVDSVRAANVIAALIKRCRAVLTEHILLAEEVTGRDAATRRIRRKTAGFCACRESRPRL
jgi:hypothetical protein